MGISIRASLPLASKASMESARSFSELWVSSAANSFARKAEGDWADFGSFGAALR